MATLSDPAQEYIDKARRDRSNLQRAYRDARRSKDYLGALKISRMADQEGITVGKASPDEEIQGVGRHDYETAMQKAKRTPESTWQLDRFDFGQKGPASPLQSPQMDRTAGWRQRYFASTNPDEQGKIVEDAYAAGVPLSDFGKQMLERRRIPLDAAIGNRADTARAKLSPPDQQAWDRNVLRKKYTAPGFSGPAPILTGEKSPMQPQKQGLLPPPKTDDFSMLLRKKRPTHPLTR